MIPSWLSIAALASLFGLLYQTISPSVSGGDAGDLIAVGCELGIAHPPGYPLYTLFVSFICSVHSFVKTPQELAFFVNISSTVLTVAAAYCIGCSVALSCQKLGRSGKTMNGSNRLDMSLAVLFTMFLFTFSPLIWQYATTAEVFPMNTFFASLLLYLLLSFGTLRSLGTAYTGALVCGLALCNQHSILFFEIPMIVWVLYLLRRDINQCPIVLVTLIALFLAGLTPYLYLPLAASYNPTRDGWGSPSTWTGFWNHFLQADYGTFHLHTGASLVSSVDRFLVRIKMYLEDIVFRQGLYVVPMLSLVGVVAMYKWPAQSIEANLYQSNQRVAMESSAHSVSQALSSTGVDMSAAKVDGRGKPVRRKSIKGRVTKKKDPPTSSTTEAASSSPTASSSTHPSGAATSEPAVMLNASVLSTAAAAEAAYTPAVLIVALLFYLEVLHSFSSLPTGDELLLPVLQRFWMQPNVLVFYWAGVGLFYLLHTIREVIRALTLSEKTRMTELGNNTAVSNSLFAVFSIDSIENIFNSFIFLLVCLAMYRQYHTSFPTSNRSTATYFHQYASAVLAPLPTNAVLFVNNNQQWSSLRYLQKCLHVRPDVTAINLSMMSYAWFARKQSMFPLLKFPGTFLAAPHSAAIHTEKAFTLLSFLHANIKQHKIFLGGKLTYAEPQLMEEFALVPVGLVSQFTPLTKASNASQYQIQFKRHMRSVLSQLHTLPDPDKYPASTWEWAVARDFKDRVGLSASYALQLAVESAHEDPLSLVYAIYLLESAIALEAESSVVPASVLKNAGLAHVHLIQSKALSETATLPLSAEEDIFHTSDAMGWPGVSNSSEGIKWKDWCSDRFLTHWGEFLSRPEAKLDKQYDNIKSLYEAAISNGASMKQRIRKKKRKTKRPPRRRNVNPWARR